MDQTQLDQSLREAVGSHNAYEVTRLLKQGANANVTEKHGHTPLHIAAANGDASMIELLLNNKADINATTNNNITPLHIASDNGTRKAIDLLVSRGANTDIEDRWGRKPKDMTRRKDSPEPTASRCNILMLLLESFVNKIADFFSGDVAKSEVQNKSSQAMEPKPAFEAPVKDPANPAFATALNAYASSKNAPPQTSSSLPLFPGSKRNGIRYL